MPEDNFTKMCDCPEIQDGWEPKVGDWTDRGVIIYIRFLSVKTYLACSYRQEETGREIKEYGNVKHDLIYKPSIEQLMGMVKHNDYWYVQHDMFDRYVVSMKPAYKKRFVHEREVRLAFVMHELHNKRWGAGERWE